MRDTPYNVLFLCAGNSARSIMAEIILNTEGKGHFRAYSAGSRPAGQVHPFTLELAELLGYPTDKLRSKSLDEYNRPGAPDLDLIITLCDASAEACPVWPGHPATAHWDFPDPVMEQGDEAHRRQVFHQVFRQMSERMRLLLALPERALDRMALETHARVIAPEPA